MRRTAIVLLTLSTLAGGCSTAPRAEPQAPWARHAPVNAPPVLLAEWQAAENRAGCAPMTVADPGPRAAGGTPRRANFSGGWGVAWDVPGLPGRDASGVPCSSCGRGVYGIAGAGIVRGADPGSSPLPDRMEWSGGEAAYYGLEGGSGPNWLAQLQVAGQSCVYYVWSFLGRDHLEYLIGQVRRAER